MTERNTREIGAQKEKLAVQYLQQRGFQIKEINFRCRQGEIDIIGIDKGYLVFVEVKYRSSKYFENPLAAVGKQKVRRICRVADYYRFTKGIRADVPVRYDVVGMLQEEIVWIKNAFSHTYARG